VDTVLVATVQQLTIPSLLPLLQPTMVWAPHLPRPINLLPGLPTELMVETTMMVALPKPRTSLLTVETTLLTVETTMMVALALPKPSTSLLMVETTMMVALALPKPRTSLLTVETTIMVALRMVLVWSLLPPQDKVSGVPLAAALDGRRIITATTRATTLLAALTMVLAITTAIITITMWNQHLLVLMQRSWQKSDLERHTPEKSLVTMVTMLKATVQDMVATQRIFGVMTIVLLMVDMVEGLVSRNNHNSLQLRKQHIEVGSALGTLYHSRSSLL